MSANVILIKTEGSGNRMCCLMFQEITVVHNEKKGLIRVD